MQFAMLPINLKLTNPGGRLLNQIPHVISMISAVKNSSYFPLKKETLSLSSISDCNVIHLPTLVYMKFHRVLKFLLLMLQQELGRHQNPLHIQKDLDGCQGMF